LSLKEQAVDGEKRKEINGLFNLHGTGNILTAELYEMYVSSRGVAGDG